MTSVDPYIDLRTGVLRNKLGLIDAVALDYFERELAGQRAAQGLPSGKFDLKHFCAIHRHLFQDVYDWAGDIRTVEIAKGETQFMPVRFIRTGFSDIHHRLATQNFLTGLTHDAFCAEAAVIIGDVNHAHPFREGNGRTQLLYLQQLAASAGFSISFTKLGGPAWIEACAAAHLGRYEGLRRRLAGAVAPS